MSTGIRLSIAIIVVACSVPAHGDVFSRFNWNNSQEPVAEAPQMDAGVTAEPMLASPAYGGGAWAYGATQGYPFVNRCCDQPNPCCSNIWDGFCASQYCGCHGGLRRSWFGGSAMGCHSCAQKGVKGAPCDVKAGCGHGRHAWRGWFPRRHACGGKGCDVKGGKGCGVDAGCGCGTESYQWAPGQGGDVLETPPTPEPEMAPVPPAPEQSAGWRTLRERLQLISTGFSN